jgi:hypothetical protein
MTDKPTNTVKNLTDSAALAANLHQIGQSLRIMTAALSEVARYRKASYDAHIAAGFTPEQALAICHRPLF